MLNQQNDNLLVGTKQGHLLMYSVTPRNGELKRDMQLLRYNKTFSKKPIQQLEVVPEHNILIRLSDNVISVHDMAIINFPIITTIQKTKGATLFTMDVKKHERLTGGVAVTVRICVAVKRKLQLYYWKNSDFHEFRSDLTVADTPRALEWCNETIVVGLKNDYSIIELSEAAKTKELFPTGKSPEPIITKLTDNTFALAKETQSVFMNYLGDPTVTYAIKWSQTPNALAYDDPYLLALLPTSVQVQTFEPVMNVQTLPVSGCTVIRRCKQGVVYVASLDHVWCLQSVPREKQIHVLLERKQFQLALKLTNSSENSEEDKKKNVYQIQTLYAFDLFRKKQFHDSMNEFLNLKTDPYDVIRLFPTLLPQQARGEAVSVDAGLVRLEDKDLESGLLALIEYLTAVRLQMKTKGAESTSDEKLLQIIDTTLLKYPYDVIRLFPTLLPQQARGEAVSVDAGLVRLEDKDLESGLLALIEYLTAVRLQMKTKGAESTSDEKLLQIIDTTLLKCYLQTNDALVAPLLRRNHCHLEETERTLKKHQKYNELVILYQTKGIHNKALEILQKQSDQSDGGLKGPDWTIQYLQGLGKEHINLIIQFSGWVLDKHPEDGLKIFTEDMPEVEQLPRPRILDYLLRTQKSLVIPYLEHVIHVWKDTNPLFHNVLIHQYREKVLELCRDDATQLQIQQGNNLRTKLLNFLEKSEHYVPETVHVHFPYDSMYEERAIILERLGKHEQALSIYVIIMNDIERAIAYCDRVHAKGSTDVFVPLIRLLVDPPTASGWLGGLTTGPDKMGRPNVDKALEILERKADKIPPLAVLDRLPDNIPLTKIKHFLSASLQTQLNNRRRTQMLKGLLYAEHLQVQEMRMHHESKSVTMTDMNICPVCKKRFGNQRFIVT
ncbi:vam6/Vps39-like protein [Nilaparvata lugens]|uniref:vam6/Vps39-like protein n=1 Tax=Nilaparvata lugens TaxID=108931 RepID=UPI00193D752A|nr:vam6/Vps39-like protein [Nilaparvata lugens]